MPAFGDFLLCGVSTQLEKYISGFDELIAQEDEDFLGSGLKSPSLIRLSHLAVLPNASIAGKIGNISALRLQRLKNTLADYLTIQR